MMRSNWLVLATTLLRGPCLPETGDSIVSVQQDHKDRQVVHRPTD